MMISDDVYDAVSALKKPNESYTQVLARMAGVSKRKKQSLLDCAGLWSHLSEHDAKKRKSQIRKDRRSWRKIPW